MPTRSFYREIEHIVLTSLQLNFATELTTHLLYWHFQSCEVWSWRCYIHFAGAHDAESGTHDLFLDHIGGDNLYFFLRKIIDIVYHLLADSFFCRETFVGDFRQLPSVFVQHPTRNVNLPNRQKAPVDVLLGKGRH